MFAFVVVKWRNLKSPVSSAAIQVELFASRASFNSRAILLLLTLMSNDVVTQGSARSRLILNTPITSNAVGPRGSFANQKFQEVGREMGN